MRRFPTAHAVGFILAPLRGCTIWPRFEKTHGNDEANMPRISAKEIGLSEKIVVSGSLVKKCM